jgi:hypothetical protein
MFVLLMIGWTLSFVYASNGYSETTDTVALLYHEQTFILLPIYFSAISIVVGGVAVLAGNKFG